MNVIPCTYWPSLREPVGRPFAPSWEKLAERFSKPLEVAEKTDAPGWAPVRFAEHRRAKANVQTISAIGFDFDELEVSIGELAATGFDSAAIVHSTYSHMGDGPRARAIVRISRPISVAEHERLWTFLAGSFESIGFKPDPAAKDPSRLWFVPSVGIGKSNFYVFRAVEGAPLDVDAELARIPAPAPAAPRQLDPRRLIADEHNEASVMDRARAYLAKCAVAVSGSGGHNTTFVVASKLVRGFGLDVGSAFELMSTLWNPSCQPPWSQADLIRKVQEAAKVGRMPLGSLRDAPRRRTA